MLTHISDFDDPRLDPYRDLPRASPSRNAAHFIVEGRWLVERLLASEHVVESLLLDEGQLEREFRCDDEIPVYVVPAGSIKELVGFSFHRGVLACGRRKPFAQLSQVLVPPPAPLLLVVCLNVVDAVNLGGILRNAAAFEAAAVLFDRTSADPFSRRAIRVSMAAALELPLVKVLEVDSLAGELESFGIESIAAVADRNALPLDQLKVPKRSALFIGNEGFGLDSACARRCRHRVQIVTSDRVDSLNAAVASGICLHHLQTRLRRLG